MFRYCPPELVGDDAAIITVPPEQELVVSTDMLVDGVHFSDRTTSAEDVGWRAAAANLSDLAAMGATPIGLTIGLGLPPTLGVDWVEALYTGFSQCLQHYGGVILGGDVCRSSVVTVSVTVLGQVRPDQKLWRSGARPGQVIVATGVHGASRAGLELLQQPQWGQDLSPLVRQALIQAHCRPQPRLDVLPYLRPFQAQGISVAGMDSSDGLADAVVQICEASGVGAQVWCDRIPMPPSFQETQSLNPEQALDWALYGGEDFELILCLPADGATTLVERLGNDATICGEVVAGSEVLLIGTSQSSATTSLRRAQGYQHF
nr:thiamine-phosphate kinase [Petrachloros mirabilis]